MSVTCHHLILLRQDLPLTPDLGWHLASPSSSLTSALKIAEVTATCNSAPDFYGVLGIRTQILMLVQQVFLSTEPPPPPSPVVFVCCFFVCAGA